MDSTHRAMAATLLGTVLSKKTNEAATIIHEQKKWGTITVRWGNGSTEHLFNDDELIIIERPLALSKAHYWRSPNDHILAFLKLAEVSHTDVVADIGCGDGNVLFRCIEFGAARGVGVDLSPVAINAARHAAEKAGLGAKIEFLVGDAAECIEEIAAKADVLFLYTLPAGIKAFEPALRRVLETHPPKGRPPRRLVTYRYHLSDAVKQSKDCLFGLLRVYMAGVGN